MQKPRGKRRALEELKEISWGCKEDGKAVAVTRWGTGGSKGLDHGSTHKYHQGFAISY